MEKKTKNQIAFQTKREILEFISTSSQSIGTTGIAHAFSLNREEKVKLKKALNELREEGFISFARGKNLIVHSTLPSVAVVRVIGHDDEGNICAEPLTSESNTTTPKIFIKEAPTERKTLAPGEKVLAKLSMRDDQSYEGKIIRRIGFKSSKIYALYSKTGKNGRLKSTNRNDRRYYFVSKRDSLNAKDGELVRAEVLNRYHAGMKIAKIVERINAEFFETSISQISILETGIPTDFSDEAIEIANSAKITPLNNRRDLRNIPLVTIDDSDARDFDDAVFAERDTNRDNPGGWHLIIAVADVAWYVRPGNALDSDAAKRSNSVYFPDRVIPMLPEVLSNGWCSLKPNEDRPCMAVHLWINAEGTLINHFFVRGLMRSHARLTYKQVQDAQNGKPDQITAPIMELVISPLFGAYEALRKARQKRGALELELAERKIILSKNGQVERIKIRERHDSHKLIEEFMITANVAAAETLEKKKQPCLFRVHDEPSRKKMETLRQFLDSIDIPLAKGQVIKTNYFNQILKKTKNTPHAKMVNDTILRCQSQAEYNQNNIGHFGLALKRYCHFTSPIRRYADLLVHRSLIECLSLGEGSFGGNYDYFENIGATLSRNERRAALAERDASDRYCASFLSDKIGNIFTGHINGVTRFGLFITLNDSGADGLVPIRSLGKHYFTYNESENLLHCIRTKETYQSGDEVQVILVKSDAITNSLIMNIFKDSDSTTYANTENKSEKKPKYKKLKKRKSNSRAGRRKIRKKLKT